MGSRRVFLMTSLVTLGLTGLVGLVGRAFAVPKIAIPLYRGVIRDCVITCPVCNEKTLETMSRESLKRIYHCPRCLTWLSPYPGDHCIYDSYGSVKCPRIQLKRGTKLIDLPVNLPS